MIRNDLSVTIERSGDFDENTFGIDTEDVKAKLIKYVNGRLKAGKIPTIRNAQKAVKGVSVGDIRNILYDAGYLLVKDGKVFTLSNV